MFHGQVIDNVKKKDEKIHLFICGRRLDFFFHFLWGEESIGDVFVSYMLMN